MRNSKLFWLDLLGVFLCGFLVVYLTSIYHLEPTQAGIGRNRITGQMFYQQRAGYHIDWPWVWVSRIDTCPIRVGVPSAGKGYNSKLVKFNPKFWFEFVQMEGWHYYWWYNRFSFNFGYTEEFRGFKDIMRGHAYSTTPQPFIQVLSATEITE